MAILLRIAGVLFYGFDARSVSDSANATQSPTFEMKHRYICESTQISLCVYHIHTMLVGSLFCKWKRCFMRKSMNKLEFIDFCWQTNQLKKNVYDLFSFLLKKCFGYMFSIGSISIYRFTSFSLPTKEVILKRFEWILMVWW